MAKDRIKSDFEYLESFKEFTDYFLVCEKDSNKFNEEECNIIFIKIFNSILFEQDEKQKNRKISYLVFWLNFIIEFRKRNIKEPLLTTILTIIDKLDLHQLIKYTAYDLHFDFFKEITYELRKIFDNNTALTDSQIDMFLSILSRKNIIISAPTSYGKTDIILRSLLLSLEKDYIRNFVVILPTKSLINEYRKKIHMYCKERIKSIVITEAPYIRPEGDKVIFLFTQERFLIFNNTFKDYNFDYAVFDEVQDLINIVKSSNNERSVYLAKAISIIENKKVSMAFLMPFINKPYETFISKFVNEKNFVIIDNLFPPTSSIKYLIKKENRKFSMFDVTYNRGFFIHSYESKLDINEVTEEETFDSIKYDLYKICKCPEINCLHEKNLFYCKKSEISEIARLFAQNLKDVEIRNNRRDALIKYLADYIGEDFELIEFIKKGVSIHTGDLDSFTKRQIEQLFFDDEKSSLNHIFCTSTLLKGVNLNANNLFFLAKKGKFDNTELDKKNLLGRVGRLGSCLQGRIFRFYVKNSCIKFDTIKKELNAASEPCEFSKNVFRLPEESKRTNALRTYISDKDVKNQITGNINKTNKMNCFDYFLGHDLSKKVQKKINNKKETEINQIIYALKLSNYDSYIKVIDILADIYEWKSSSDFDLSHRMIKSDFTARLFYNVAIGTSIKRYIKGYFDYNENRSKKPYVIKFGNELNVWFLSQDEVLNLKNNYKKIYYRKYTDKDKNILIYTTLRDINVLIEFKLKTFLQDLYYRLGQITEERSEDLESFLTHSIVGDKKKIALKNIGIIDDFAINILCKEKQLFDNNDNPILENILSFAYDLPQDDPVKYAIEDVFGKLLYQNQ